MHGTMRKQNLGNNRRRTATVMKSGTYVRRIVDSELDELVPSVGAISIEGPKAVGKTETALQRAKTVRRLDDPGERAILEAAPQRLVEGSPPILVDEWQRLPQSWDLVRREVDRDGTPGRFLLTGSAAPAEYPAHSGAGRIVTVRIRPMTLMERGVETPTVNLRTLLEGNRPEIEGRTSIGLEDYTEEILASGFPGLRGVTGRALRAQLDGYLERIVQRDFEDAGYVVRKPQTLTRWLAAYAAATSTVATWETLRRAATAGEDEKPSRTVTRPYRDVLERLWILDPVPGWAPTRSPLSRLALAPKHQLADPALASRLLGATADSLLEGRASDPHIGPKDGTLLGQLFESLVTLSVRVFAQATEARVFHLRTKEGRQEIDLIIERADHRVLAVEVKLSAMVTDDDVRHLKWLEGELGDALIDMAVIHTGPEAYRRKDGVAVIPAALLGA